MDYRRGSQIVRRFTRQEDALMTALRIQGCGTTEIAKMVSAAHGIPRSPATINMRLKSLARVEEGE